MRSSSDRCRLDPLPITQSMPSQKPMNDYKAAVKMSSQRGVLPQMFIVLSTVSGVLYWDYCTDCGPVGRDGDHKPI